MRWRLAAGLVLASLLALLGLADPVPVAGGADAQASAIAAPGSQAEIAAIIAAARTQIGESVHYDPAYVSLEFPGGDVARDRGVCTDVLIRALRDGAHIDLQLVVNRDMKADFDAYPKIWGLTRTDANIDHRRVPNLATLLNRLGAELPAGDDPADFRPGDIVTMMLPGNLPHILLVSDRMAEDGTPLVIHNIGRGAQEEDALMRYPHTGHFRLEGEALAGLRRLGQLQY
ncbi:MAG: DUF1287 domain-containing protein [Paracoccus sp. (in: a-proteobacteria)]